MACSVAVHVALFALRPLGALIPPRNPMHPLEVSYVVLEPVLPGPKVAAPVKRPEPPPAQISRPAEPQKPPPAAAAPRPPAALARPVSPLSPARESLKPPEPAKPKELPPPAVVTEPRTPAAPLPEGEFAAMRYKEMVREHLRKRLHYPETMLQGTVRLKVHLLADGSLQNAEVPDASDPRLAAIALRDAREAGPYPRFPKEMDSAEADCEFLVQYRPGDSAL